ncbi:RNA polymerase II-specific transcription factor-like protein [Microdochium nivale]|nr:RNA polymerase II-specific transcription factor-like protein [Microdochium nivale]
MHAPAAAPSTTRRKSCLACTRSKRCCDLGLPQCSRCAERQLSCVYAPVVASRRRRPHREVAKETSATIHRASLASRRVDTASNTVHHDPILPVDVNSNDIDVNFNIDIDIDSFDAAMLDPCLVGTIQPGPGFDMMNSIFTTNLHNATPPATSSSLSPSVSYYPQLINNNTEITMVPSTKPLILLPADAHALHAVLDPRLHYTMAQFRVAPEHFALSCQTPWSHPLLYRDRLPRSVAIAQACCALHVARCPANAAMVTRNIANHARELCLLVLEDNLPSSSEDPMLDLLAHMQALLLFQIMLHFDPDPLAKRGLPLAARAMQRLMLRVHNFTSAVSSPYPVGSGPLRTVSSLASDDTPSFTSPSSSSSFTSPRSAPSASSSSSSTTSYELSMLVVPPSDGNGPPVPLRVPTPRPRHGASSKHSATATTSTTTARPMPAFLALSPLDATRQIWRDWILHESARRTVLIAGTFMMLQMLSEGRFPFSASSAGAASSCGAGNTRDDEPQGQEEDEDEEWCHGARDYCVSPWTLSRDCWEAEDAVDFAVGWNKRAFTVLSCADLELRVHEINPVHVDALSKMILTLLLGIDETKGWLLSRGGVKL